ncbi:hypothetical protein M0802_004576 [Mischocyttarus mexicanus]|nr:hypothetical protein M0802_004576 [Mischocyttarus mexicanus]
MILGQTQCWSIINLNPKYDLFPFSSVTRAKVADDPEKGFGFITFADPASVDKVLAQGNHELDGKKIDPKVAFPRRTHPKITPLSGAIINVFYGTNFIERISRQWECSREHQHDKRILKLVGVSIVNRERTRTLRRVRDELQEENGYVGKFIEMSLDVSVLRTIATTSSRPPHTRTALLQYFRFGVREEQQQQQQQQHMGEEEREGKWKGDRNIFCSNLKVGNLWFAKVINDPKTLGEQRRAEQLDYLVPKGQSGIFRMDFELSVVEWLKRRECLLGVSAVQCLYSIAPRSLPNFSCGFPYGVRVKDHTRHSLVDLARSPKCICGDGGTHQPISWTRGYGPEEEKPEV